MTVTINGSGTMTGLAVGGLNDNIITPAELSSFNNSNGGCRSRIKLSVWYPHHNKHVNSRNYKNNHGITFVE